MFDEILDKLDDVADYVGGNLQNSQEWTDAKIDREKAKTALEIQAAQQRAKQIERRDKLIENVVMFLGLIVLLIVLVRFVVPAISSAIKKS